MSQRTLTKSELTLMKLERGGALTPLQTVIQDSRFVQALNDAGFVFVEEFLFVTKGQLLVKKNIGIGKARLEAIGKILDARGLSFGVLTERYGVKSVPWIRQEFMAKMIESNGGAWPQSSLTVAGQSSQRPESPFEHGPG